MQEFATARKALSLLKRSQLSLWTAAAPATATTEALLRISDPGAKNALALDTAADTSHKTLNDEMTAEFDSNPCRYHSC